MINKECSVYIHKLSCGVIPSSCYSFVFIRSMHSQYTNPRSNVNKLRGRTIMIIMVYCKDQQIQFTMNKLELTKKG